MRMAAFAGRNGKEILRDPLNIMFGLGFPIIILLLLTAIQANIPVELFRVERLSPGIALFGLSFITLFSATVLSRDRMSALLQRLFATPLTGTDYILGYMAPMVPIALGQTMACYAAAVCLGLEWSVNILWAVLAAVPSAIFFTGLGLLCGTIFSDRQVGGICGALLTNVTALLSGTWFDLDLAGGWLKKAAELLPFVHGVEMGRAALAGNLRGIFPHIWWVLGYTAAVILAAAALFVRRMKES